MAEHSTIEWTDATWNPVTGCSIVSPGCTNCYAMRLAGTRLRNHPSRAGLTRPSRAGPVWNGEVRLNEQWLDQPLRWRRPRRIFVCAHGDLFHESVPDQWIDRIFAVMALSPQHTFQVLTKRAERMRDYLSVAEHEDSSWLERLGDIAVYLTRSPCAAGLVEDIDWPLPNVWLGVSAEDEARADERIPLLLDTPAAVHFLSAEPLLGPLDATEWLHDSDCDRLSPKFGPGYLCTCHDPGEGIEPLEVRLDWVIVGGESGSGARPMHPDWARSLRDQCAAAGVPFHFKQWGSHRPTSDADGEYMTPAAKSAAGRTLDGRTHDGMP